MFEASAYIGRREKLKRDIGSGIILFVGNCDEPYNYSANCYPFRQDSSFLYYFGIDRPKMAAIIDVDNNTESLCGPQSDADDTIWSGNQANIAQLAANCGVATSLSINQLKNYLSVAIDGQRQVHILPPYRASTIAQISFYLGIETAEVANYVSVKLIQAVVAQRSIKESAEIDEIERMVNVAGQMHLSAMRMAKPGTVERKIAAEMQKIALECGYGVSFAPICSVRGEVLHNPYYNNTLQRGQLLLTDAGAESLMHYASDITRVSPVGGKFSVQHAEIYNIVLAANIEVTRLAKPGVLYKDIHLAAAEKIAGGLIAIGLMKGNAGDAVREGAHALFFPHGIGHMLGLDVHDMENLGEDHVGYTHDLKRSHQFGLAYLRLARKLEPGFVVTNEPGIYFIPQLIARWEKERKCLNFINFEKLRPFLDFGGIRIEDNLLITNNGCRVLGNPIPKTISEVEAACGA